MALKDLVELKIIFGIFFFLFGLAIGSFLNVVIYRLPEKKSLFYPPSHCPSCEDKIKWYHNIPLISYLVLRGKCAYCGNPISIIYPIVELLTGLLTLTVFLIYGYSLETIRLWIFVWALIPVIFIDLEHFIIPDKISFFIIIAGLIFASTRGLHNLLYYFISGISASGGFLLFGFLMNFILKKEALGLGDVKLMGGIGVFLGVKGVIFTAFVGSVLGIIISIPYLLVKGKVLSVQIPFGPFLSSAAIIYVLYGEKLINLYLSAIRLGISP